MTLECFLWKVSLIPHALQALSSLILRSKGVVRECCNVEKRREWNQNSAYYSVANKVFVQLILMAKSTLRKQSKQALGC